MANPNTDVLSVKTMLEKSLVIPDYQRPYKWEARHVNQLIDDLIHHRRKPHYRLGTVVLHQELGNSPVALNIVDGQQRLLTLTLLYSVLDDLLNDGQEKLTCSLLEKTFSSSISIENIKHNAQIIESRLKSHREILTELRGFLLHRCELICIALEKLNEAFQFFDSQNARGKALYPHDLLKAFHLREMMDADDAQKLCSVAAWEADINPSDESIPTLDNIMAHYLFRIRRWAAGESGLDFSKDKIDTFKGITLAETQYPWVESLRATDSLVAFYNAEPMRAFDRQYRSYPFQLDQPMINGQRFFEYVQHYIQLWKTLFVDEDSPLKELLETIREDKGSGRTGDRYVRNLFYCAVLYYYDKFGDEELKRAANLCFLWAYKVRLTKVKVMRLRIDKTALAQDSVFRRIHRAKHPHEVLSMTVIAPEQVEATHVDNVREMFNTLLGCKLEAKS